MASGLSTGLANLWLGTLLNIPYVAPQLCVAMHVGEPGPNGTANPSAVTTRSQMFLAGPAAGGGGVQVTVTGTPPMWLETASEVITNISVWDAFTSGHFLWSALALVPKTVVSGDVVSLTSATFTFPLLAS